MKTKTKRSAPRIAINRDWCKGCYLCVKLCPKKVFELGGGITGGAFREVVVVRPAQCTRCMLCELHCPDLAIEVE